MGRYHEEPSSLLITDLPSTEFNLQSSGLVAKPSVFKTSQFCHQSSHEDYESKAIVRLPENPDYPPNALRNVPALASAQFLYFMKGIVWRPQTLPRPAKGITKVWCIIVSNT